jgi:hypothetical protein
MADGWEYDLTLDNTGFVGPMKEGAQAVRVMTEEEKKLAAEQWRAEKAAKAQADAEKTNAAALEKSANAARAAAAAAENVAQAQSNAAVGTNKVSNATRVFAEEMNKQTRAAQQFAQVTRSVTAQAGAQLAQTVSQIGREMGGTIGEVTEAMGRIGSLAAQGGMFGPKGAIAAAAVGTLIEVGRGARSVIERLTGVTDSLAEADRRAASGAQALAEATARKAERLKEAAAAARESVAASAAMLRDRESAESGSFQSSQAFQKQRESLQRESRRIAAQNMSPAQRIEEERKLALEEIASRHQAEGAALEQGVEGTQRNVDRLALTKRNSEMARNRLPRGADGERAALTAEIERAEEELKPLRADLERRRETLKRFRQQSPQIQAMETGNVNASFDQRAREQQYKDSDEERERQLAHPLHPDNIAARKKAAAEEAQAGLDKRRDGLLKQIDQVGLPDATPRRGREGAAPGSRESRKIYGAVSRNTIGTSPQDRLREAGMLAQRARKTSTGEEAPATEKQVQMLEKILRELQKQSRKPDRNASP